ncbi:MAG: patatin-like phospholipase family protein [Treponema sp.]|nr:patatin-like phospholipase family protein [Treponema sp.]
MRIHQNLKWALVLSGGGAKGLAHVGVINAFAALGFPCPSFIAGTSMGAIVGGLYACGMDPKALRRFVLEEFDINNYLDGFVYRMNGPAGKLFRAGQIIGNLATRSGIDSGQRIIELFERLTDGKRFDQTSIPFRCNAVDLASGGEVVFDSGSVAKAIRASMALPALFEPLIDGTCCYADGGLAHNLPVFMARNAGFRHILAVDVVNFRPVASQDIKTVPDILYRSLEASLHLMQTREYENASLTIHASDASSPFDFDRKKELVSLGEQVVYENEKTIRTFFSGMFLFQKGKKECGVK